MKAEQTLSVSAIKDGTVVDHIQAGKGILLLRLFRLDASDKQVTAGMHFPSTKMGSKDIVKIEGWQLSRQEASKIAISSPAATVNIIQNYKVADKYTVPLPVTIEGLLACPNTRCITNHEKTKSFFHVTTYKREVQLQCRYCEKSFSLDKVGHYAL